jgi:rubredoxin-NAD+ reductase
MKTYMCVVCGYVYEEAEGRPEDGIAPGTAWADVPADWMCPECNVGKAQFQMMEI